MEDIYSRDDIALAAAAVEEAARQLDMQPPQQLIGEVLFGRDLAPQQLQKLNEAQAALAALANIGGKGDADVAY